MNYTEKLLLTLLLITWSMHRVKGFDVVSDASTSTDSDNQDTSSGGNSYSYLIKLEVALAPLDLLDLLEEVDQVAQILFIPD